MKKLIFGTCTEGPLFDASYTILRVFAGLSMGLAHGLGKIPPAEGFVGAVAQLGFPMPEFFAWAAGLSEFAGGILLALGLLTRPAALMIAFTMLVAAFLQHGSDPFNVMELSLFYLVSSIFFAVKGGGRWSIDQFIAGKKS